MTAPTVGRAPIVCATAGLVLLVLVVVGAVMSGMTINELLENYVLTNVAIGIAMLGSGIAIAVGARGNAVGALFLVGGLGHLASAATLPLGVAVVQADGPDVAVRALVTVFLAGWLVGLGGPFPLALLLFPDGRLPSRRWRLVAIGMLVLTVAQLVVTLINSTPTTGPLVSTPLTAMVPIPDEVVIGSGVVLSATLFVSIAALIVRYVRGDETVERRLLWLILAVMVALVANLQRWLTGDGPIVLLLAFLLVPVAMAIAIVRPRLFDIRLVVSRAITYAILVVLVVALFVGLVAGVSLLVPPDADRAVAIGAALVVALAFAPLRTLLQSLLARAFYGSRADPARTASVLGADLGDDAELDEVLERVRASLRLPVLALRLDGVTRAEAAGAGDAQESRSPSVDLVVAAGAVLEVHLRPGESRLHSDDERTLVLVGTPLALLARTRALAGALRDSRAATVEARERERSVLRRDLHDGLGPTLTGAAYRIEAARNLLRREPDQAESTLAAVEAEVRTAIAELRRVVAGLRPLELEERGLWGALARLAEQPAHAVVQLHLPESPPPLSPAIELAAYRIVSEALTNVERHSAASTVRVSLRAGAELEIDIVDDGGELGDWKPGVGVGSIQERAEELGGAAVTGPVLGGWRVHARLPL